MTTSQTADFDRKPTSFCKNNWFIVTLASYPLKSILLKTTVTIQCCLRPEGHIALTNFTQPFFISARACLAEIIIRPGVDKRKIRKTGQCLKRFPGIKSHRGIRIVQAINEIGIQPVAPSGLLRTLPTHSPGDQHALAGVAF